MKIAIVHDWQPDFQQELDWNDGLANAVKILGDRHEVKFFCEGTDIILPHKLFPIHAVSNIPYKVQMFNPDVILVWADGTRPNIPALASLGKPIALAFSGGMAPDENMKLFNHIFVESQSYLEDFRGRGYSVSTAFGTNESLFTPYSQPKAFDVIFPATFALWKNHKLFAESVKGLRALAVGYIQPEHESECWKVCEENGITVLPHVSADVLKRLYAASKVCVITSASNGGSQRTVLEAMAMNIPLVVSNASEKTSEYLLDGGFDFHVTDNDAESIRKRIDDILAGDGVDTRDYILSKWTSKHYADALEEHLIRITK